MDFDDDAVYAADDPEEVFMGTEDDAEGNNFYLLFVRSNIRSFYEGR